MINFSEYPLYSSDLINEHAYHMKTRGYNVFEDFYSDTICETLKESLRIAIENYKPMGSDRSIKDKYHIHDLICNDIIFGKKLEDPRIQQIVAAILGDFWIMYAYTSASLPPGGVAYGSRLHVDSPRFIDGYTTNVGLLWALDDFFPENGSTKLLPGSHHSSAIPNEECFEKNCIQLTCKKGSLVVFDARVFHRAGENKTDKWRHSLTMNVCRPYMKQRMDWVRFVPKSISEELNQQARRIIGFDTRLPSSLEDFFVEENNRLYKSGQE